MKKQLQLIGTFCLVCLAVFSLHAIAWAEETVVHNFAELKAALDGSDRTITLEAGDYAFTETLTVSGNVVFKNNGDAVLKRDPAFTATMLKVTGKLQLLSPDGKLKMDGEKRSISSLYHAGSFITVQNGTLIIDGAVLTNDTAIGSGESIAPVYATGAKAQIIFNSGEISNTRYEAPSWSLSNKQSAGGIYVADGARLTMNGGAIKNNHSGIIFGEGQWTSKDPSAKIDGKGWYTYYNAVGGVIVEEGAHFTMTGGVIENNKGCTGGVYIGLTEVSYLWEKDKTNINDLKKYKSATFELTGGTIRSNIGWFQGGGVHVSGIGKMYMKGGLIDGNKSFAGGGILVMDGYKDENGTTAKVSLEDWKTVYPAAFEMTGGTISENMAIACGGGIDLATDNALLTGGTIKNNIALDQGGGVYVTCVPYTAHIQNAFIAGNRADGRISTKVYGNILLRAGSGGGVWFCPTGTAEFYAENGIALAENHANLEGDDFWGSGRIAGEYKVTLADRLPGGSEVTYYRDEAGNRYTPGQSQAVKVKNETGEVSVKAVMDPQGAAVTKKLSALFITDNRASKGGGVGSNGNIVFGKVPEHDNPQINVDVVKIWQAGLTKKEITVELRARLNGLDYLIQRITLNEANGYRYSVRDLPATVGGQKLENLLYLKEAADSGYRAIYHPLTKQGKAADGNVQFVLTIENVGPNQPTPTPSAPPTPPPVPKTGDGSPLALYALMLVIGLAGMTVFGLRAAKRKN